VAYQALAAVLGGTQSLHTNSMDEALGLPTEESVRLALRTQQILAYETGVADSVDPLGGSYLVEKLTDELEARAETYLAEIDDLGGSLAAIEAGYIQREIQASAYQTQMAIETGDNVIVGVNRFSRQETPTIELHKANPAIEAAQRQHIDELRATRNNSQTEASLDQLAETAQGDSNMLPAIIQCLRAQATLGEITDRLRLQWGEYRPTTTI
jgi:methylmalonyl-CoA mutase N-terminal domain/subunit